MMPVVPDYPGLRLNLFGPFEVGIHGEPMRPLRSRRGQWLLALLALRANKEVERSWLAGTLWPDSAEKQAYASLRTTLLDLRKALGPQAWRVQSPALHSLRLDLAGAECDVVAFDEAIVRGTPFDLEQAVARYRGPLLEGCAEDWLMQERQAREQSCLAALEAMASAALCERRCGDAVEYLRRAIRLDPLRESAHRSLMKALAEGGDYAAALFTYRELRLILTSELNTEPAPDTVSLYQQIRQRARNRHQAPASPSPVPQPAHGRRSTSHNLPASVTSFVGREQEIRTVKELLRGYRLVTLTGAGGCGKSRLAVEIATDLADEPDHYPDGVWLVELAALSHGSLLQNSVAAALGINEEPGRPLLETLTARLRENRLVLLLDNCEHLKSESAALISALLRSCPGVRVLATSRESLHAEGEHAWRVPSLRVPDLAGVQASDLTNAEQLGQYESVRLFVDRAAQQRPGFQLTDENAHAVGEICSRLDGIPLALELAAARARLLSPEQIALRMNDRFRLLTGAGRSAAPRQQTLRATMDCSYEPLEEEEKRLLQRLSVFAGGWTLEAAEAVGAGERIAAEDVLDLLTALWDKSLINVVEGRGESRYGMLETVREYAFEKLNESFDTDRVRRRQFDHFLKLAEEAEPQLIGPNQAIWLSRLEADHENLGEALKWCQEKGDPQGHLRLAGALLVFWDTRAYWTEGRSCLEAALARVDAQGATAERAKALHAAGVLTTYEDGVLAQPLLEESLAICKQSGDRIGTVRALTGLGDVWYRLGDKERACSLWRESLSISREMGDMVGAARSLHSLGWALHAQGDTNSARPLWEENLAICKQLGHNIGVSWSLGGLAEVAHKQGAYALARSLGEQKLQMLRQLGDKRETVHALGALGHVARAEGDYDRATTLYRESLALRQQLGEVFMIAQSLEDFAGLAVRQGHHARAARLLGAAEAFCETLGRVLPVAIPEEFERAVHAARAGLGSQAFAAAWAEGRELSIEQAVEVAMLGQTDTSDVERDAGSSVISHFAANALRRAG